MKPIKFDQIFIGSDHAGFRLKGQIIHGLNEQGIFLQDLGCQNEEAIDYPDIVEVLVEKTFDRPNFSAILICGSGIGMSIAANRHKHIRAALCNDIKTVKLAREHNGANVLVLGAKFISSKDAIKCVLAFLTTSFSEEQRHINRINKL